MVVEIATILLGTAAGVALVLYAAPRGLFGHPKRAASVVAKGATTYTPETQAGPETKVELAPVQAEPAPAPEPTPTPSPAPAIYETVQPETSPALPPAPTAGGSSAVTFGATATPQRATRTYRRRTVPSGTPGGRTVRHRERKH